MLNRAASDKADEVAPNRQGIVLKHALAGILIVLTVACGRATEQPTQSPTPTPAPPRVKLSFASISFEERIGDLRPIGVFVEVPITVRNISDSSLSPHPEDFTLIDENGDRHNYSFQGTLASWLKQLIRNKCSFLPSSLSMLTPIPAFTRVLALQHRLPGVGDQGRGAYRDCIDKRANIEQFRIERRLGADKVGPGEAVVWPLVFDIPTTGFSRQLKVKFRDDPSVPLEALTPKDR